MDERLLSDWSGTRYGVPCGLERPSSVEEVSELLRRCGAGRQPIAVQGGRTGVSGGAAPGDRELVLSVDRLNQIEEFDRIGGAVVVGAGLILDDLQREVEAEGWSFPLDLASRGSCQIGGNVATNAGGSRVLKYGSMRSLVLGVEAVLADGSVLGPPNRLLKNNAGYSLSSLIIGSEGTLGIVTRVALRLVPLPAARRTALLALAPGVKGAVLLGQLKRALSDSLSAFEVMWPDFVAEAQALRTGDRRLPATFAGCRVVLVEVEGNDDEALAERLESALGPCFEMGTVLDAVVSTSARDAASLWLLRESVAEIQAGIRPYVGFDLGLPATEHEAYVKQAKALVDKRVPGVRSFFFAHAGDDNLHAVIGPCETPDAREAVEAALYELLPSGRSSVTAEHGIGRKRKPYLALSRAPAEIAAMRAVKQALDPHNLLNPGRVFDL